MQFQTIMLILMHIPGTTVSSILEWMERFSSCFLESITTCRAQLGHGQIKALQAMKDSERFEPFRSFVDCLLSIDKVGVVEAFDEIAADRAYNMESQQLEKTADLQKKGIRANQIAFVPMYVVLGFYLLIPMIRYAVAMFAEFQKVL